MKEDKQDQDYEAGSKTPFQGIKDKGMGLVANISERVEIWSKIIRIRVKISSLKKEVEENMKKVGATVYRSFSSSEAEKQIEIKEEMRKYLQRIRALNEEIEELETMIKSLEEKRQQMMQHSQVTIDEEKEAKQDKITPSSTPGDNDENDIKSDNSSNLEKK